MENNFFSERNALCGVFSNGIADIDDVCYRISGTSSYYKSDFKIKKAPNSSMSYGAPQNVEIST